MSSTTPETITRQLVRREPQADRPPVPPGEARHSLESKEAIIRNHLDGLPAGRALRAIKKGEQYKDKGYDSLVAYCEAEFGIKKSRAYQLMRSADVGDCIEEQAAKIAEAASTNVDEVPRPAVSAWLRPLHSFSGDSAFITDVWTRVTKKHHAGIPITMNGVADAVDAVKKERDDSSDDESSDDESSDDGSSDDETLLDAARRRFSPLLDNLNTNTARGLLNVARLMAETTSDAPGYDDIDVEDVRGARTTFDGLSHREPPITDEEDGTGLPAALQHYPCLTKQVTPFNPRDMLIAVPREMVTPTMARRAVPIGTPTAHAEVGVPVSCFDGRPPVEEILDFYSDSTRYFVFNKTNEQVDWASHTVNPITGCLHTCPYCYARYLAEDMCRYKQGFHPTFYPYRLLAFRQAPTPHVTDHVRQKNTFVCSMADPFGDWVPDWIIRMILDEVAARSDFNFLFLTKFPQKLSVFDFPENAWIGTSIDKQSQANHRAKHLARCNARVKWLSCEPMLDPLMFDDLTPFDAVVIGAQEGYGSDIEEVQPHYDWVVDLYQAARAADCAVYCKENLDPIRPKELPGS